MNRLPNWLLCVMLMTVVASSALGGRKLRASDQPTRRRPNILFFLADDQRNDQLGCAGHAILKTPNIDRLAAGGVRFTNAFVTTSICAASRATILTGLYERSHKFTFRTQPLATALTDQSYPALLREAGYRTGFVGKFGVKVRGDATGRMFDYFRPLGRNPYFKPQPDGGRRHVSEIAGDLAVEFLRRQDADRPFCLSVSFNAPHAEDGDKKDHYPWPKAMDGLYEGVVAPPPRLSEPGVFQSQPEFLKTSLNRQRWFWRWDTPDKYQKNIAGYWRMISGVDHVIGRVLEQLRTQGLADNTVVIYSADNGYYLGSRGFAGKWSHYEESLRVPLIVNDPRADSSRRGKLADQTVLNVDVPATILQLAGVSVPSGYQGRGLAPIVAGESPAGWREDFFCEHLMHVPGRIPKYEGVRGRRWVYARYFEQQPAYEFLHDLESDPDQLKNLADEASHRDVLAKMRRLCDELRDRYGGEYSLQKFPLARAGQRRRPAPKPDPATKPNVVLIISDDQSWTDYGFMGHPVIRTPNLDRLARQSATFTRGYVPTALCRSSLATLITGLYTHQHKITGNDPAPLAGAGRGFRSDPAYQALSRRMIGHIDNVATLPRLLAAQGYVSHQSGKWWEGGYRRGGFTAGMTHGDPSRGGRHGDEGLAIGRQGMKPVLDFIDGAGDRPFFVWYAPFLPHSPHNPPARLLEKYTAPNRPVELAKYYAMCEWFDETCGTLLKHLDRKGLADNTLVLFVADNGWIQRTDQTQVPPGFNQRFAPRSKQSPYEGGVRTPIMVRWPGVVRPARNELLVSSIDIAPTILAACGVQPPAALPGINLLDVARGEPAGRDAIFGEGFSHDVADIDDPSKSLLYRWCIEGRWKLILTYDGKLGRYKAIHPRAEKGPQLYDLLADPFETQNRAEKNVQVVARLSKKIARWWPADTSLLSRRAPISTAPPLAKAGGKPLNRPGG